MSAKRHFFLPGILAGLLPATIVAVEYTGTVVNCCGDPLVGALVEYPSKGLSSRSGSDGRFILNETFGVRYIPAAKPAPLRGYEIYDLRGILIAFADGNKTSPAANSPGRLAAGCYAVLPSGSPRPAAMSAVTLREHTTCVKGLSRAMQAPSVKKGASLGQISISMPGYTTVSVLVEGETADLGAVELSGTGAPFPVCEKTVAAAEAGVAFGYERLLDSLKLSVAECEWSGTGVLIQNQNTGDACLLDVRPWGLYSIFTITGAAGTYSISASGYAGFSGLTQLAPLLTKTGHVSGLMLKDGASIDSTGLVVLLGDVMNPDRSFRSDVRQLHELRAALPFDSTIIRSRYYVLESDYERLFSDSGIVRDETVSLNGASSLISHVNITTNASARIEGPCSFCTLAVAGTLFIGAGATLQYCRLSARRIMIEDGNLESCHLFTTGKVFMEKGIFTSQVFACDSMVFGRNIATGETSLWVARKTDENRACICFGPNDNLKGTAISFKGAHWIQLSNSIHLDSGTVFTGYLITDGDVSVKFSDITGSIYTSSITTQHGTTSYINYLIGVKLHTPQRPLLFPFIRDDPTGIAFSAAERVSRCF